MSPNRFERLLSLVKSIITMGTNFPEAISAGERFSLNKLTYRYLTFILCRSDHTNKGIAASQLTVVCQIVG